MLERTRALIVAVAFAAALGQMPAASAAGLQHVVVTTASTFVPGDQPQGSVDLTITQGDGVILVNASVPGEQDTHDLTHDHANDPYRDVDAPLFGTEQIRAGQTAEVRGVEVLEPGTYPYFCDLHPNLMTGTLEVLAAP